MRRALWLVFLLLSVPACAEPRTAHGTAHGPGCESAIAVAQLAGRLPDGLLHAVALVESGRADPRTGTVAPWPWTIDVGGQGYFFPTKQQAVAAVKELMAAGVSSIDVGCLQINLAYHPAAFRSLEQAFDPMANARYAAKFLNALFDRSGDWKKAVGAYHSETPSIAAPYQARVLAAWHPPAGVIRRTDADRNAGFLSWEVVYRVPRSWEDFAGQGGIAHPLPPPRRRRG